MDARPSKRVKLHATQSLTKSKPKEPSKKTSLKQIPPTKSKPGDTETKTHKVPASHNLKGKARESEVEAAPLPTSFKVVAGSYEKLLYGLQGTICITENKGEEENGSKLRFELKPVFIFPAHVSCIKAVAASPHGGKWLATGSADEIIKIWDLRRRKEVGGLMHHLGSITHLSFPSRSHLISGSEDGTLCLFHARDWTVLRVLRGHKARVNSVAVHPSGKVALSVGKDKTLRMWDLMRGKGVASTKLDNEGEVVRWSIGGTKFAVQSGSKFDIYTTNMTLLHTITHSSRIHDILFCHTSHLDKNDNKKGEVLLVGAEDRKISVYRIDPDTGSPEASQPAVVAEMVGHTNRIKAVRTLEIALPPSSTRASTTIACTVSSDGFINIYDIAEIPAEIHTSATNINTTQPVDEGSNVPIQIKPLTSYDSKGTRFTCVALADGDLDTVPRENGEQDLGDGEGSEDWGEESMWGGIE